LLKENLELNKELEVRNEKELKDNEEQYMMKMYKHAAEERRKKYIEEHPEDIQEGVPCITQGKQTESP